MHVDMQNEGKRKEKKIEMNAFNLVFLELLKMKTVGVPHLLAISM